jgi:hypothetical protein
MGVPDADRDVLEVDEKCQPLFVLGARCQTNLLM